MSNICNNESKHPVISADTNTSFSPDDTSFYGYISDQSEESVDAWANINDKEHVEETCCCKQEEYQTKLKDGLAVVEKLVVSKKTVFASGPNGLQAYWTCATQSCLCMMVKNGCRFMEASKIAAESHGGLLRVWVKAWLEHCELPVSQQGHHSKVFSLLDDPEICTELHAFLQMNKWLMNPQKLMEFSKNALLPHELKKHTQHATSNDMPGAVKAYLELQLFPQVQVKVVKGISLQTALLVAQDEMTAQCNDGRQWSWVWRGEQPLKKKGAGCGLHQSDVIALMVGWLVEASQTLEYGKNYEGYWTGELFIKEKIIPAFECAYPPNYQMLLMVDNSQGHSAYAEDALLVSRMNMNPGGKQAVMQDGWFVCNGERVTQTMVFPPSHPQFPGLPKGMQQNCDYTFVTLQDNMQKALASVSVELIQKWEH
ncbi:hypothetical protein P691DRAFT_799457 [Macrolepiota fuliginosa MF-IS2]|uniref:Uncharacterized protein n=1 Tax=Macrolepiota fuliginosa MF-IS2 TaxID=1400762 RepID=A0A9P5WYK4_9AGAR|nr:hypothetical protein P691DRAFT_799457 [Macrolepiota fuliginosa MF-IS2]